jgi:hypothetical protein
MQRSAESERREELEQVQRKELSTSEKAVSLASFTREI